jgi:hypothetical protein
MRHVRCPQALAHCSLLLAVLSKDPVHWHVSVYLCTWLCTFIMVYDVVAACCAQERKDAIEARNEADTVIYSTERSLAEYRDKLPQNIIDAINTSIADLRGVMEQENAAVSRR